MGVSKIEPAKLFAKGDPKLSKKEKIVFRDPKGCQSEYIVDNPKRKNVCEISIDGKLLIVKSCINSVKRCIFISP